MYKIKKMLSQIKEDNENNRIKRDLKGHNWLLRKLNDQEKLQIKIDKARLSNRFVEIRSKRRKFSLPVSIPLRRLRFLTSRKRKINMDEDKPKSDDRKQESNKVKINPVSKIPTTAIIPRARRPTEETADTNQQRTPTDYTRALMIDIPPSSPPFSPNRSHIPSHDLQPLLRYSEDADSINDGNNNTLIRSDIMNDQIDNNANHRRYFRRRRPVHQTDVDASSSASQSTEAAQENKICQTDDMFAHNSDDTNLITFLEAHGLNKDRMMSLLAVEKNNNSTNTIDEINNDDKVMNQKPKHETAEWEYCFSKNISPHEREVRNSSENLENSIPSFMDKVLSHLSNIEHVLCDLKDQKIELKVSPKKSVDTQTVENTESNVVVHSSKRQRVPPTTSTPSIKRETQRHVDVLNDHHTLRSNSSNNMLRSLRYYNTPSVSHRDPRTGSMHLMQGGYQSYGPNSRIDTFYNAASGPTGAGVLEMFPGNQVYNMAVNNSPNQQYMKWLMRQQVGTNDQSNEQQLPKARSHWEAQQNMPPRR